MLNEDRIWSTAQEVWENFPLEKVASPGFVHAYRITKDVIKAKGDNNFLGIRGSIHVGVDQDFKATDTAGLVLVRKDGKVIVPPPQSRINEF